ncbi:hypothetical protein SEA_PHINKY_71 [Microbacterium phage Phinky]|nr:hypothetical protein SEA_PHINKY_71 [Microbacterium phage Phinky]
MITLERFVDGRWVAWDGIMQPGVHYIVRTTRIQVAVGEVRDILANLDLLNEAGRMRHDDYFEIHNMVSGLLP